MQIFECVNLYDKCNGLSQFVRSELSGDSPDCISWGHFSLRQELKIKKTHTHKKQFPDGVTAVCLAVNFLWENATFADSNHKYNPIKSYYVNVNRVGDKTRQWNVSFRPKWLDFSGHKESPLGGLLQWQEEHANQTPD